MICFLLTTKNTDAEYFRVGIFYIKFIKILPVIVVCSSFLIIRRLRRREVLRCDKYPVRRRYLQKRQAFC